VIDRINGPSIKPIGKAKFPKYTKQSLDNGIELFLVPGGTQDMFKLEFVCFAGRRHESKPGVARLCSSLIKEGSPDKNSAQLSEHWDYYGALVNSYSDLDSAGLSLTGLNKHSTKLVKTWCSLLESPSFESSELDHRKKNFADKLGRELSKNEVIAYRNLTEHIYGVDHFYGYNTLPEDYLRVDRADILDHYHRFWGTNKSFAVLAGKITPELKEEVISALSQIGKKSEEQPNDAMLDPKEYRKPGQFKYTSENKLQAAIKLAHTTLSREDEDYPAFYFLIEVFGGYFGSRLMKNLREEKGLCYNIYASIERLKLSNYLYISAEVDGTQIDQALSQIKAEIERLQNELIGPDEMEMVRNYIKGVLLAGLDGPFRSAQMIKSYLSNELHFAYFSAFIDEIEQVSAKKLMKMAQKYLDWSQMTIVIVGP